MIGGGVAADVKFRMNGKLRSSSEFISFMSKPGMEIWQKISTHQVKLVAEKLFIILNAFPTHISWATTIKVVLKSVFISAQ